MKLIIGITVLCVCCSVENCLIFRYRIHFLHVHNVFDKFRQHSKQAQGFLHKEVASYLSLRSVESMKNYYLNISKNISEKVIKIN